MSQPASEILAVLASLGGARDTSPAPSMTMRELGLSRSVQLLRLQSAVERIAGRRVRALTSATRVADLLELVSGNAAAVSTVAPAPISGRPAERDEEPVAPVLLATAGVELRLGVDLEEVASMPDADNLRAHDFFRAHFTDAELSYALLRPNPKATLCGMFCAKEALKKCFPEAPSLRLGDIHVAHVGQRPVIGAVASEALSRFRFEVSISHTAAFATATVIATRTKIAEAADGG